MTNRADYGPALRLEDVLVGGTDAASMLIFDPAALPEDYDSRARHDPIAVIEQLAADQRLYWLETAGDGGYSLGVCVCGRLPSETEGFARPLGNATRFAVPSGRLYFTGIEYAFRLDDAYLRKHPHMGTFQEIPPGTYRLALYEMDYPEGFHEDLLRKRISPGWFRLYSLMGGLIPLGCMGLLVLAASPFLLGLRVWSVTALPCCLVLALPAIVLSRTRTYREARGLHLALQHEYPDYLATLEPGDGQ